MRTVLCTKELYMECRIMTLASIRCAQGLLDVCSYKDTGRILYYDRVE